MTDEPAVDPLFGALAALPPMAPRQTHDRRVRSRCHAALARRRVRPASARPLRLPDLLVAGGVAVYVMAVVTEAVRLLG